MRIALFLVLLLSPALAQDVTTPAAAPAAPEAAPPVTPVIYTVDTPVEKIAADPAAAAVVRRDLPGLLEDSNYKIFKTMSLKQLQAASGGDLSRSDVDKTVADLQALAAH